ncbi:polysaccharide lyase family 8 super-sandwich domain-containing protein [Dyadobacter tibetensis]|uniref:polysaccharide lyase family 8 super-sandwich domain-containing protein n=1 Tax=Dyadobacter tibetensis TaxID=1211851 RepID=UPI0004B5B603|nr:polysaccharide lyase family 8 super-sandwich domain-containing protein [Dyadobacter tibetensis]
MMTSIFKGLTILILMMVSAPNILAQSEIELIKSRIVADLMSQEVNDDYIDEILKKINPDGSFPGIDYTDLSRTAGFPHRFHNANLLHLSKAFMKESSRYFRDEQVKSAIVKGLSFWLKNDFVGDNWHDNQISTPTYLGDLVLIVGDQLPEIIVDRLQPIIGRAHMNASGARPSGDRIVIAGILAKNLLFRGEDKEFEKIINIIEGELKFATGSRGMQHDYSFHHRVDRVNNTDSYGYGKYANAYGDWSYYVSGTRYAFSKEKINQLVDYYLDGIYKQSVYGIYPDVSVQNRSITIKKPELKPRGTQEIERILASTDYRRVELEEIIRLRKGEIKPGRSFAKFFWQTEHFVFQRPDFYTTVRMFSSRNRNMEVPYNGPGKPTHHRADGTNYLLLKGDEYHNIWPVYDWQKISGTTILQKPELPSPEEIQKDGLTDFVGAVTDGLYGAVTFDFKSPHDPLQAKKSWFFFDEEYVCLGADIKADSKLQVATTLNQSLLRSPVHISEGKNSQLMKHGGRELKGIKWVHHDRVGYVFPEPEKVSLSNQVETGNWASITDQKNISQEEVQEGVFKLWLDHGSKPANATYAYMVVPNVSEQELERSSKDNRSIDILSNTANIQAVHHKRLGISQLSFYHAGELTIDNALTVRLDSPGMVMLKQTAGRLSQLTLADPSRKLSRMLVTVSGQYPGDGDHYRSIVDKQAGSTLFIVDLPVGVYLGKSVVLAVQ